MARGRELSQLGSLINIEDSTKNIGVAAATPSQKVGIGTNSPTSKVEVVGDVLVSGIITATSFVGDGSGISGLSTFSGSYNDLTDKPTIPTNNNQLTNGAGYITGYTVTQSDVTQHQAALSITESQISDLGSYATTSYVDAEVAGLVDSAPGTLDTLNELAAALGDDANFSTTVTNSIATKLPLSGGQMTGNITFSGAQTVDGRDLSVDGAKLDGIAAGAQVNVQSDWNATSGDALILNKPTIPTNNNQLTNGAGYITGYTVTQSDVTQHQAALSITESQISDLGTYLTNSDLSSYATQSYVGLATAGLASETYVDSAVSGVSTFSGSYNDLTDKPTIPTNNNQLTNGAGYITATLTNEQVQNIVGGMLTGNTESGITVTYQDTDGTIDFSVSSQTDNNFTTTLKNKLDGIESGATADQTASEILTAIKTVDGSGSGLDADTLDGQQGSYYQPASTALTTSTTFGGDVSGTYNAIVVADDSHNHIIGNVDGLQTALDAKAPLASPALTGTPTAPTATAGTNSTQVATTAFVSTAVANVVDSAPAALDTLNELAAALGDDPNFATTVTTSIGTKLPLAGGQMTGNITFSGSQTVDGRDLSVDGAKLDGIESGATADQTASEILTAIKTVDGSGSGLDADTVDGIDSTSFLRSDANDTASGEITLTSTGNPLRLNAVVFNNTEASSYYTGGTGTLAFDENFFSDGSYGSGTYDPITVFTGSNGGGLLIKNEDGWGAIFTTQNTRWASTEWANLKIGSNQVWHAGNDGSGSELDADTVDGIQASSFLRSDASDTTTGNLTVEGIVITNEIRNRTGQQLVLNAGESQSYATGQTGEHVYVNAEAGLQINSSPDNWGSGWAGRNTAEICKNDGTSTFPGDVTITGLLSATTKSFVIDHPTKEGMKLRYGSLEGPENGVYVRGRLKDNNTIELPDYWTGLVHEDTITVNLTPIGTSASLHSVVDIVDNTVVVESANGSINCFYTVFGERKDVEKLEVEY